MQLKAGKIIKVHGIYDISVTQDQALDVEDPIIIARFFDPGGTIRWYVVEYYPDNNTCYAYFTGMPWGNSGDYFEDWDYFSIDELENMERPFLLNIERDRGFKETRFNELRNNNFKIKYT